MRVKLYYVCYSLYKPYNIIIELDYNNDYASRYSPSFRASDDRLLEINTSVFLRATDEIHVTKVTATSADKGHGRVGGETKVTVAWADDRRSKPCDDTPLDDCRLILTPIELIICVDHNYRVFITRQSRVCRCGKLGNDESF